MDEKIAAINTAKKLSCKTCQSLIAKGINISIEANNYIIHFCSPECRLQWEKNRIK